MIHVPIITSVVLNVIALRSHTLLTSRRREHADTLLLARRERVAKLSVRAIDRRARRAALIEMIILQHRVERSDLRALRIVSTTVGDPANALASRALVSTDEWRHLMLALLPDPHVLGIVTAAAAQIDG